MTFIFTANTTANTSPRHIVDASIKQTQCGSEHSPFNWRGPSKLIDSMGRIKTARQMLLDATRVNKETQLGTSTRQTNSYKAAR